MIRTVCLFLLLGLATSAHAQTRHLMGRVLDAATASPIPGATVRIDGTTRGAAADAEGRFHVEVRAEDTALLVSAIGYAAQRVELATGPRDLVIQLVPVESSLDAVTVQGEQAIAGAPSAPTRTPGTTEDLLTRLPAVRMIQRANFASEPVIRGYNGGQVSLTIDGMPVYGACVDKMDPASSYVEPENLSSVEMSAGASDLSQGSQIGGAVDLVTRRPRFDEPLSVEGEVSGESNGLARRVRGAANWSQGSVAVRVSGSYRGSDDYAPGGGEAIPISGYEKRNLAAAASLRLAEGHVLTAQLLTDDAWLVGYPALLMDAVLAQARLGSLLYEGTAPGFHHVDLRLYRNRVDHYMDDRFRDVRARDVMRGMYMPMDGDTDVWGGRAEAMAHPGNATLAFSADLHRLRQFGDMTMYSVYPGVRDMVLLNVGDVTALNGGVSVRAEHPVGNAVSVQASARLDGTSRDVGREAMRQLFAGRTGNEDVSRQLVIPSVSATATATLSSRLRLHLMLASAGRLPTLVEQYGHYVYNYVDGYFYTGDPDIAPERSRQVEVGAAYASTWLAIEASVYAHALSDVVVGLADRDVVAGLAGSTYRFRLYDNAESGWMTGGEVSALARLGAGMQAVASVSAAFGQNTTFNEPLPMVPPVGGVLALRADRNPVFSEAEMRWALAQNRVARFTYAEDPTDGFAVFALRAGWRPTLPSGIGVQLQTGVENLFDAYYQEHLAISDLAARGRNVYLTLGFDL